MDRWKNSEGLISAERELAFQNKEKEKRAAELVIANKELVFQNEEREKAKQELIQREKQLTKAQQLAHMGSWEIDMIHNTQTWSDGMYKIYGIDSKEQPSTELFLSFIHPDDLASSTSKVEKSFSNLEDSSFNFRFIRKGGEVRYACSEYLFEFDQNKRPVRLYGIVQDITEQKKAEEKLTITANALKHALSDLNKIMDSSLDVICAVDAEGIFLKVSAASERVWGYKPEELIGKPIFDIVYHEDTKKTQLSAKNVMAGSNLNHFENRYVRKDGSLVPIEWTARWDEKDQIRYGVARDITEKKRLEKSFEIERQRFHDLFLEAPSSMGILKGANHEYEIVNPLYLQLIGKKNIIGKTVKEVLPEMVDQGFIELLDGVYKTGKTFLANEMLIKLDPLGNGKLVDRYLNFMYQAHRTNEDIIDGILFFAVDVSEQVLSRQKIEESESRLNEAQRLAKMGSWNYDIKADRLTWSEELYDIFDTDKQTFIETHGSFLHLIDAEDRELALQTSRHTRKTGEPFIIEYRITTSKGEKRIICEQGYGQKDDNGKIIRLFGTAQNITDQRNAEIEKAKIIADIVQRSKDLEQFSYIVSHNLRAPVANIIGLSQICQNEILEPDLKKELMEGLFISVKKLDEVINDLNNILQTKREVSQKREIVHFSKIANNIHSSVETLIEKEKAVIVWDFSEIDEMITVKSYIHSIFYNLISNSLKYCRPDIPPVIEIKSRRLEDKIELLFKDNGIGIDLKKEGDFVFGLYKRFHKDTVEGKGMGLYMVKTQVETIGGKISVSSEVNKGTEFKIKFTI